MAATQRDKLVAQRMREVYAALRAKRLADLHANRDTDTGLPVSKLGSDEITRAALRVLLNQARHVEIVNGMARLTSTGLNEAFRIEERRENKEVEYQQQQALFGKPGTASK
jgi:hypothetical protein